MNVLALIPARAGSKSIPSKNFRELAGVSPLHRAIDCAALTCSEVYVSTDADLTLAGLPFPAKLLKRPPELAQDDTPMIDVVTHALSEIPGPEDQVILLLQPTQPLRQPKHLTAAIDLLTSSGADSVVSVVELPRTHHPVFVTYETPHGFLQGWAGPRFLGDMPARRQDVPPVYIRDGTAYCFRRSTLTRFGNIYGDHAIPLVIPATESCPLDEPSDWARAEELLRAR